MCMLYLIDVYILPINVTHCFECLKVFLLSFRKNTQLYLLSSNMFFSVLLNHREHDRVGIKKNYQSTNQPTKNPGMNNLTEILAETLVLTTNTALTTS